MLWDPCPDIFERQIIDNYLFYNICNSGDRNLVDIICQICPLYSYEIHKNNIVPKIKNIMDLYNSNDVNLLIKLLIILLPYNCTAF